VKPQAACQDEDGGSKHPVAGGVRRYDVITLFPEMFAALTGSGITRRAKERGLYELAFHNPRDFTHDPHRTVDDRPYGGGPGMVMLAEPLMQSIAAARSAQQRSDRALRQGRLSVAAGSPAGPGGGAGTGRGARPWCCCAGATRVSTSA